MFFIGSLWPYPQIHKGQKHRFLHPKPSQTQILGLLRKFLVRCNLFTSIDLFFNLKQMLCFLSSHVHDTLQRSARDQQSTKFYLPNHIYMNVTTIISWQGSNNSHHITVYKYKMKTLNMNNNQQLKKKKKQFNSSEQQSNTATINHKENINTHYTRINV